MSSLPRKILRILLSAAVGFWTGFVAGTLTTTISSEIGVIMLFVFWIGMTYLLYRYYHPRILVGSSLLAGAVLCLLIPLGLVLYSATRSGPFATLVSLGVSVILSILLAPLGLVLAYFGYRLTMEGISRMKREEAPAPRVGITVQPSVTPGAVFCRFCGAQIAPDHTFCAVCGRKQPSGD